jgi:protoporphyrinogen oxidase
MLWEACAAQARAAGAELIMGCRVTGLACAPDGRWTVTARAPDGDVRVSAEHVISSAPLREVALALEPGLSPPARDAAMRLRYRDLIVVTLIARDRGERHEHWIYVHDPGIRAGRVQNFKSWSPEMVPDPSLRSHGVEYFCFEGDALWSAPDAELVALATRESRSSASLARTTWSTGASFASARRTRSTTSPTRPICVPCARSWRSGSRRSTRSAATACTGTTTRITR